MELDPIIEMLVKERHMRNWTQWDVARRLGHTNTSTISQWERGNTTPVLVNLRAWAAVFDGEILARLRKRRGRPRTNFK